MQRWYTSAMDRMDLSSLLLYDSKKTSNRKYSLSPLSRIRSKTAGQQFYTKDGYPDFDLYLKSSEFLGGIERVLAGMRMNDSFSLMCAEKGPINCHRAIMVARGFEEADCNVQHIRTDGVGRPSLEDQRELERRLIKNKVMIKFQFLPP